MYARKLKFLWSKYCPFTKSFANFKNALYNIHWNNKQQIWFMVKLDTLIKIEISDLGDLTY